MISTQLNYLAIFITAALAMVIGALWFSELLFGKLWMVLVGKKMEDLQKSSNIGYVVAFGGALLSAFVMGHFIKYANATTWDAGLRTAVWAWLGFTLTSIVTNYMFAGRSWKLALIDAGYFLVTFSIMGMILAVWR